MKLPHLDQLVALERGEAGLLARALGVLLQDALQRPPMGITDALLLGPLASLTKRLVQRHQQEQLRPVRIGKRPAARTLRVRYDELAMVHLYRHALPHTHLDTFERQQLQVVLGRFHQKSLNLAHYITF